MAKKGKQKEEQLEQQETLKEEQISQVEQEVQQGQSATMRSLRYVGKTINHFSHNGVLYQLVPNTVYINLPECEQVKRLIQKGELKEL